MIVGIRHKGLKRYFTKGDASKLDPRLVENINTRLQFLDAAETLKDINIPGFNFHPHKGNKKGQAKTYCIHVNGPCIMTFKFEDGDVYDLDLDSSH